MEFAANSEYKAGERLPFKTGLTRRSPIPFLRFGSRARILAQRLCSTTALALLLQAGLMGGIYAADASRETPTLGALKVDAEISVDGVLDEPFWAKAPVATGFIDIRTHRPADQQTTIRVAYTPTHFYIAVECFDDQVDEIHASERREDRAFVGDDWVEIHIDPAHSHRGKYAFFTNPLGTKADANEGPSGVFNYGWTAEWDVAAKILSDRWVFEMKIPFTVINYQRKDARVWGLNVTRCLRRTDSLSFWSFNATDTYKPRNFGHLSSLDLAQTKFDRNWEVTPYISTQTDFNHDTDTFFQGGLDVSFRLTPSVTTAWTLNPDFGQVESDDDTIELRDTERYLPEKRLFFREGDELIRMPHRLYYSRRFSEIDAGARVSGQLDGISFAFLNILGETQHDGKRYGDSSVLRVLQDVGERSNLGYFVADSEFEDGYSRVVGADGYFYLTDAWRYRFQAAGAADQQSDLHDRMIKDRFDFLGHSTLIFYEYPWDFSFGYNALTREFNPHLAFIPRQDIFGPYVTGSYAHQRDDGWYKALRFYYEGEYYENESNETSVRDHDFYAKVTFHNEIGIHAAQNIDYHAPYHNPRTMAGIDLFEGDYWKSFELDWAMGEFEEIQYQEIHFGKPIKFIERLPIRYEFVVRFENQPEDSSEVVWLNRIVFDFYFTDKMWVKTSLQNRDDGHNISVIYGWEFYRRTYWYLVYNDVDDEEDSFRSIYSKIAYTF